MKSLCLRLIQAGRKVAYISKGRTELLIPRAEADGCLAAVSDSTGCRVQVCA